MVKVVLKISVKKILNYGIQLGMDGQTNIKDRNTSHGFLEMRSRMMK
jgi:hypothetical protein